MIALRSVLVIRRDNIGDLVCTTPLLAALRGSYPCAWIGVLANSYNAPALDGNPDVDEVFAYRKLKHVDQKGSAFVALGRRVAMLWALRRRKLDVAIVAAGALDYNGERFARMLSPARIVRSSPPASGQHEVERTFSAARTLGYEGPIPPLRVVENADATSRIGAAIRLAGLKPPLIGVHISARRIAQRWPTEYFAAFALELRVRLGASVLLFWSPGAEDHPQHPGDDGKAARIMSIVGAGGPLLPCPTADLRDLVSGLAQCDAIVCSDGGAMHLAAGLGKPIVCFFGDSPVDRWRPWGVRHTVLQAASNKVKDVPVEAALAALAGLLQP